MDEFNKKLIRGFTLVEIIIVIGLIAILTSATLLLINPFLQFEKSRDATRKSDIKQIQAALEQYKSDNENYPGFGDGTVPGQYYAAGLATALSSGANNIVYLGHIPTGPNAASNTCLNYLYVTDILNRYTIFTTLENANDSDAKSAKTPPIIGTGSTTNGYQTFVLSNWTGSGCPYNFWVNNP